VHVYPHPQPIQGVHPSMKSKEELYYRVQTTVLENRLSFQARLWNFSKKSPVTARPALGDNTSPMRKEGCSCNHDEVFKVLISNHNLDCPRCLHSVGNRRILLITLRLPFHTVHRHKGFGNALGIAAPAGSTEAIWESWMRGGYNQ